MWALAPLRQDACLHCQLRRTLQTLRRERLPKSSATRHVAYPARSFGSQPVRRHQEVPNEGVLQRKDKGWSSDQGFDQHFQEEYGAVAPSDSLPLSERYRDQVTAGFQRSRRRQDGGYFYRRLAPANLNKIALEMSTLGEPASILRLDDNEKVKKSVFADTELSKGGTEDITAEDVDSHGLSMSQDILQDALSGSTKLAPEEIVESVEQVRDEWLSQIDPNEPPSQPMCHKISQTLSSGFTIEQLELYLNATAKDEAEQFDDLQGVFVSDVCTRSKWFAGVTKIEETSEIRLFSKTAPSDYWRLSLPESKKGFQSKLSKKENVIEAILRRSWGLRSQSELSKKGEMDLVVSQEHWTLLESRYNLSRQLEDQLRVEVEQSEDRNILRIKGKHQDCGKAFAAIYAPLQAITIKRIELQNGIRSERNVINATGAGRLWQDKLLNDIGAFTRSLIRRVQNENGHLSAFDVIFIAPERSNGSGAEMMILNNVRRIIDMITSDRSSQNDMGFVANLKFLQCEQVPILGDVTLPMHHRSSHWYRFRDIRHWQQNNGNSHDVRQMLKPLVRLATSVLTTWKQHQIPANQDFYSPAWATKSRSVISVKTGYLAFNDPTKEEPLLNRQPHDKRSPSVYPSHDEFKAFRDFVQLRPRMFISSLPGGITSFERINETDTESEQCIVIRLKPAGFSLDSLHDKEPNLSLFPDLVLEMKPSLEVKNGVDLIEASLALSHPTKELVLPSDDSDLQLSSKNITQGIPVFLDSTIVKYVDAIKVEKGRIDERSILPGIELEVPKRVLREYQIDQGRQHDLSRYQRIVENSQAHTPKPEAISTGSLSRPTTGDLLGPSESWKDKNIFPDSEVDIGWLEDLESNRISTDSEERFDEFIQSESPSIQYRSEEDRSPIRTYYQFSGIEYHSRLRGSFRGYPLTYSIVDAGAIGGQHEELVLEAIGTEEDLPGQIETPFPRDEAEEKLPEEGITRKLAADVERSANDPDIKSKLQKELGVPDLERWYSNRFKKTPGISWFLPWIDAALEMVRKLR